MAGALWSNNSSGPPFPNPVDLPTAATPNKTAHLYEAGHKTSLLFVTQNIIDTIIVDASKIEPQNNVGTAKRKKPYDSICCSAREISPHMQVKTGKRNAEGRRTDAKSSSGASPAAAPRTSHGPPLGAAWPLSALIEIVRLE